MEAGTKLLPSGTFAMLPSVDRIWQAQYLVALTSQWVIVLTPHHIDMEVILLSAESAAKIHQHLAVKYDNIIYHIERCNPASH